MNRILITYHRPRPPRRRRCSVSIILTPPLPLLPLLPLLLPPLLPPRLLLLLLLLLLLPLLLLLLPLWLPLRRDDACAGAITGTECNFCLFVRGRPFPNLLQLLSVLPPQSADFLPEPYKKLMIDPASPLLEYYPTEFEVRWLVVYGYSVGSNTKSYQSLQLPYSLGKSITGKHS